MLYGIDVASYQGKIDWDLVAASKKATFVYARAIHITEQDPLGEDTAFVRNHDECKRLGIPFGAYLFYIPQQGGADQANRFLAFARGRYGDLSPMIDVENNSSQQWGNSFEERLVNLKTCINVIEAMLGIPVIYTNQSTWKYYFNDTDAFSRCRLWVADYPQESGKPKHLPGGWPIWTIHQYASDQSFLSGIGGRVDLDCLDADNLAPLLSSTA
jgi:lysozyme